MSRMSDLIPVLTIPETDEEKYIIEEMKAYYDETCFSSVWCPNKHVDNVVALGKKNIDFLMKLVKESIDTNYKYSHFLIDVIFTLYKDDIKVEGHLGVSGCMKFLVELYNKGLLKYE